MVTYLEFEKPVAAIEAKIAELRAAAGDDGAVDITKELWPFLIALIALLFVLVYVPELTLWLPMKMGYEPVGNFNL